MAVAELHGLAAFVLDADVIRPHVVRFVRRGLVLEEERSPRHRDRPRRLCVHGPIAPRADLAARASRRPSGLSYAAIGRCPDADEPAGGPAQKESGAGKSGAAAPREVPPTG